ncbi:MAG: hypothetical protein H6988_10045 [Pseudomonadales bacterium]|nr:hypothetical protein [Anaerolineales bacterium]MCB8918227.1 hypothetical protein [Ardenticatenaceae bacterium]MCP5190716.1 hypothetical protein [Pseudomonadales bacterium]
MSHNPAVQIPLEQPSKGAPHLSIWAVILVLVLVGAFIITLLTTSTPSTTSIEGVPAVESASVLYENPELVIARQYAALRVARLNDAYLAVNPELAAAHRYTTLTLQRAQDSLMATNPELLAHRRYTADRTAP